MFKLRSLKVFIFNVLMTYFYFVSKTKYECSGQQAVMLIKKRDEIELKYLTAIIIQHWTYNLILKHGLSVIEF